MPFARSFFELLLDLLDQPLCVGIVNAAQLLQTPPHAQRAAGLFEHATAYDGARQISISTHERNVWHSTLEYLWTAIECICYASKRIIQLHRGQECEVILEAAIHCDEVGECEGHFFGRILMRGIFIFERVSWPRFVRFGVHFDLAAVGPLCTGGRVIDNRWECARFCCSGGNEIWRNSASCPVAPENTLKNAGPLYDTPFRKASRER